MKELKERADKYVAAFPETSPQDAYINGFLQGYRQSWQDSNAPEGAPRIDYTAVKAHFNEICKSFSKVTSVSEKRKEKIRTRWAEFADLGDPMEIYRAVLVKMEESAFLRGENQRKWRATFDWLIENSNNWVKVYEGHYADKTPGHFPGGKQVNSYWDEQN